MPGKANSAAEFLSRMKTDPYLTIQRKLTDHAPTREIELERDARATIVS